MQQARQTFARMKIDNVRGPGGANGARRTGGTAAPGFSVQSEGASKTSAAAPAGPAHGVDAVLALQVEEGVGERRARQLKRGREALDALDELERGLVDGRAPGSLMARLRTLRPSGENTGEPGLDQVLNEIDIRVAVELAKLERGLAPA